MGANPTGFAPFSIAARCHEETHASQQLADAVESLALVNRWSWPDSGHASASDAASSARSPTCRPPSTPIWPSTMPAQDPSSGPSPPMLSWPNSIASPYHPFELAHYSYYCLLLGRP